MTEAFNGAASPIRDEDNTPQDKGCCEINLGADYEINAKLQLQVSVLKLLNRRQNAPGGALLTQALELEVQKLHICRDPMRLATTSTALVQAPSSVAAKLDAARRAVESRFLDAGQVLAQAVEGLGRLITSLDQLGKALDDESVAATTAELRAAAADLLALPERHAGRWRTMADLVAAGDRLAGDIEDMGRNLAYLRAFSISVKITAGGISSSGREFADFAQEIKDCIELGRGQLDGFGAELSMLRDCFKTALGQEQSLAAQCDGLLPAVPDGLIASAQAMIAHRQRIAAVADEVAGLARGVQRKIGLALAALQIGDITRQRIEHVGQTLDLLEAIDGVTSDQRRRMTAFVHGLLTAQLRATATDFHRDVEQIGAAMGGMAGDASEILRLQDLALGREEHGDKGFLRQMENHVGQALGLVAGMSAADLEATTMGGSAAAAAAGLGARISGLRTIRADVQQMALNTTLKCARLGDAGKPLGVIAVELRIYAGHLETSAQAALSDLDALSGHAASLADGAAAQDGGTGSAAAIGDTLSTVAQGLQRTGDAVETDLAGVARQGEAVVRALNQAAGRLDFQKEIGAILDEAAEAFAISAGDEPPWTDDLAESLGGLLAEASRRYTMAQEREVHAHFSAKLGFTPGGRVEAAGDSAEDVLF